MIERKFCGVQGLPRASLEQCSDSQPAVAGRSQSTQGGAAASIQRISDYRVTPVGEVHADLVCTSGIQSHLSQLGNIVAFQHAVAGCRQPAGNRDHSHFFPVPMRSAHRFADGALGDGPAPPGKTEISPDRSALFYLFAQALLSGESLGHHQQAAGIFIQAVDNSRSQPIQTGVEFTVKVVRQKRWRIYETGIHYFGRSYEEGKKITWQDGVRALWYVWKYRYLV